MELQATEILTIAKTGEENIAKTFFYDAPVSMVISMLSEGGALGV